MGKVIVDPEIFSAQGEAHENPEDGSLTDPTFIVRSDQSEVAAEALRKAIRRCHRVTYEGKELSDIDEVKKTGIDAHRTTPSRDGRNDWDWPQWEPKE